MYPSVVGVRNGVSTPLQDSSTAEVLSTSSTAPHQSTTTTAAVAGGSSVSGPLPSTRSRMQVVGVKQDTHTQYSCDARPILNGGGGDVTGKEDQDQIEGRNSDSLERERAATKIQAGVRGHHTRKELKAKKASRREKAATKIQPVLGGTKPERI